MTAPSTPIVASPELAVISQEMKQAVIELSKIPYRGCGQRKNERRCAKYWWASKVFFIAGSHGFVY